MDTPMLVRIYMDEVASGRIPSEGSAEGVAYRHWSKAHEQLRRIQIKVRNGLANKPFVTAAEYYNR